MFSGWLTFAAVLPHAQVDVRDLVTAAVAVGQLGHLEDVLLDARDVVAVVAQHPRQGRLFQLGQLSRAEHARVFIPEPGWNRAGSALARTGLPRTLETAVIATNEGLETRGVTATTHG